MLELLFIPYHIGRWVHRYIPVKFKGFIFETKRIVMQNDVKALQMISILPQTFQEDYIWYSLKINLFSTVIAMGLEKQHFDCQGCIILRWNIVLCKSDIRSQKDNIICKQVLPMPDAWNVLQNLHDAGTQNSRQLNLSWSNSLQTQKTLQSFAPYLITKTEPLTATRRWNVDEPNAAEVLPNWLCC